MKILVDEIPKTCAECLFLTTLYKRNNESATGCDLTKIQISFEIGINTRLGNCPLKQLKGMSL